jgi:hypothetical protein
MIVRNCWETDLYNFIRSFLPVAVGIVGSVDDGEEVIHIVYMKLVEKALSRSVSWDQLNSKAYVRKCVRNAARSRVRGPRVKNSTIKRAFRRAVDNGTFDDTPSDWKDFQNWYKKARGTGSPKRPVSIPDGLDLADFGSSDASRLVAILMADCIEEENPNSILALSIRHKKTIPEIIVIEKRRKANDERNGYHDPLGYGTTKYAIHKMIRSEKQLWRANRFDRIYEFIQTQVDSVDHPVLINEFEELCASEHSKARQA